MIQSILQQYGFNESLCTVNAFGTGLINNTWLVGYAGKNYILQRINQNVFKTPAYIDDNIRALAGFLSQHNPGYTFTVPVSTPGGKTLVITSDGAFRMFAFIEGSRTYDVLQKPQQAFEAAKQFGRFTKLLCGFNSASLKITLPEFHNLSLRYCQFEEATQKGDAERIKHAGVLIYDVKKYAPLVDIFEDIQINPAFKKRVTHHDTKISNVLFDKEDKGICVIDLDTVMPGYFISDVGDMLRTYLSAAGEEETDLSKVYVRDEYFYAVMRGYLGEMKEELSDEELDAFVYAGEFMIYMQALRFLTDYLNNDVYYGAKYPLHNYNRAANQMILLEDLMRKEKMFKNNVSNFLQE
ncbi:MAG TPA: aminoglycoside phosphotransferase family protein [Chitinophagaceae bacterium]|nr:aminoglycoside phosphotransferase family protein [Chitinophagaceae bacterium]